MSLIDGALEHRKMHVDEATLSELVNLARQRGSISMEDLRKALPIDRMTVEEISVVLARLDEAGFDVESDPDLLSSKRHAPQDVTTVPKPDQADLPKIESESKRRSADLPASTEELFTKTHAARRPGASGSATMLPWIAAFVIVVVVVFAAFAF